MTFQLILRQSSYSNINILDEQDPKRSPISKTFKEDKIRPKTKITLLDKGEVYIQTLEKQ